MSTVDYVSLGSNPLLAFLVQALCATVLVAASMVALGPTMGILYSTEGRKMLNGSNAKKFAGVGMFMVCMGIIGCTIGLAIVWYNREYTYWNNNPISSARFWYLWGSMLVLLLVEAWNFFLKVSLSAWYSKRYAPPDANRTGIMNTKAGNEVIDKDPEQMTQDGLVHLARFFYATWVVHMFVAVFLIIYPLICLFTFNYASDPVNAVSGALIAVASCIILGLVFDISGSTRIPAKEKVNTVATLGVEMKISQDLKLRSMSNVDNMRTEFIPVKGAIGLYQKNAHSTALLKIAENLEVRNGNPNGINEKAIRELPNGKNLLLSSDTALLSDELFHQNGGELVREPIAGDISVVKVIPAYGAYYNESVVSFHAHVMGFGLGSGLWLHLPDWYPWVMTFYDLAVFFQLWRNEVSASELTTMFDFIPILFCYIGYWGQWFELRCKYQLVGTLAFVIPWFISNPSTDSYLISPLVMGDNTTVDQSDTTLTNMTQSFTAQETTWLSFGLGVLFLFLSVGWFIRSSRAV